MAAANDMQMVFIKEHHTRDERHVAVEYYRHAGTRFGQFLHPWKKANCMHVAVCMGLQCGCIHIACFASYLAANLFHHPPACHYGNKAPSQPDQSLSNKPLIPDSK